MSAKQDTIQGLLSRGFAVDTTAKTSKYQVFAKAGEPRVYLVGSAGALRVIDAGQAVSASRSLTGSKQHRAMQCVGSWVPQLAHEEANRIYRGLVTGVMAFPS